MPKFTNKKAQQAVGLSVIKKPSAQRILKNQRDVEELWPRRVLPFVQYFLCSTNLMVFYKDCGGGKELKHREKGFVSFCSSLTLLLAKALNVL